MRSVSRPAVCNQLNGLKLIANGSDTDLHELCAECLKMPHLVHGGVALGCSLVFCTIAFAMTVADFEMNPVSSARVIYVAMGGSSWDHDGTGFHHLMAMYCCICRWLWYKPMPCIHCGVSSGPLTNLGMQMHHDRE